MPSAGRRQAGRRGKSIGQKRAGCSCSASAARASGGRQRPGKKARSAAAAAAAAAVPVPLCQAELRALDTPQGTRDAGRGRARAVGDAHAAAPLPPGRPMSREPPLYPCLRTIRQPAKRERGHDARVDEKRKAPQAHAVTNPASGCTNVVVRMDPIGWEPAVASKDSPSPHLLRPASMAPSLYGSTHGRYFYCVI